MPQFRKCGQFCSFSMLKLFLFPVTGAHLRWVLHLLGPRWEKFNRDPCLAGSHKHLHARLLLAVPNSLGSREACLSYVQGATCCFSGPIPTLPFHSSPGHPTCLSTCHAELGLCTYVPGWHIIAQRSVRRYTLVSAEPIML
jgi:hypothetical protein